MSESYDVGSDVRDLSPRNPKRRTFLKYLAAAGAGIMADEAVRKYDLFGRVGDALRRMFDLNVDYASLYNGPWKPEEHGYKISTESGALVEKADRLRDKGCDIPGLNRFEWGHVIEEHNKIDSARMQPGQNYEIPDLDKYCSDE